MLYPIELLRQIVYATRWRCDADDGVHGNGHAFVCHVVRGLFTCQGKRYRLALNALIHRERVLCGSLACQ